MVSEGSVTVEHAYTLSRLVDKGVDAEDVADAAERPSEIATGWLGDRDGRAAGAPPAQTGAGRHKGDTGRSAT
ncbi:MAG: hypothetical protein OXS29_13430 [bacterium]|nr:hypothetical protein [bacterium]MDE0287546.1 hypothetical protein [bacterium]MDE0437683.1 hypothetical protein [bacterium]